MKTKKMKLKGMTLTELLIVLAILGILVLLAYPIVLPMFQKARGQEAKMQLKHLHSLQRAHFLEYATYSPEFKKIGFEQSPLVTSGENATAHYQLSLIHI